MSNSDNYHDYTNSTYQGKSRGGCLKFAILIICLLAVAIANAQTKLPDIKPGVRLEQPEVLAITLQLDTLYVTVQRSDMAKQERNQSADRLQAIRQFLIAKFEEQNKQDTVKTKK